MLSALVAGTALAWTAPWITVPVNASSGKAQWIWGPGATASGGSVGTLWFRKEFVCPPSALREELWIAADNSAEVWLNGKAVGVSNDWSQWAKFPLSGTIKQGTNTIFVKATNGVGTGMNPGGFIAKIGAIVSTDSSWECSPERSFATKLDISVIGGEDAQPWSIGTANLAPPLIRKSFELSAKPKTASIRVIGLGDYRLLVNGQEVSSEFMLQTWSQYDKALYWREFPIQKYLRVGENVVGLMMGNSFWQVVNPGGNRYHKGDAMPQFGKDHPYLVSAEVLVDGQTLTTTDASWKHHEGPLTFSHVQGGEDFDERLIPANWATPGPIGTDWSACVPTEAPSAEVRRNTSPPIKAHERFPVKRWISRPGEKWSMDFGQNCSGVLQFTVKGKRDQTFTLRPSEVMTDAGDVQQLNLWGQSAHCDFTLATSKRTTHRWAFWYHGFRYAEIVGAVPKGQPNPKGLPVIEKVELLHIRASNPTSGTFQSSSDLLNRTHDLIDWAMRSNMVHVLSDCPHREKMGWQECAHLLARSFSYRYDCQDWLRKLAADTRDAQQPDGLSPTTAPIYLMLPFSSPYAFTVEWGAASVLLPWHLYEWYGDKQTLETSYASMKAFVDYVETHSQNHIAPSGLGDWYDYGHGHGPGPSRFTPVDLTATAMQAMCIRALAESAKILGKDSDAEHYGELWNEVRSAFLAKFYDPVKKTTANSGSPQAGSCIALYAGLIPEEDREAVLDNVLKDLAQRGYQQTPGDVGHLYFVRTLAEMGRSDVLHRVYSRTGLGSYGGILAKGLTSLPETWDAITVGSNSLNHCMLGHAFEWFYGYVLGVRQAQGDTGWKEVVINPVPGELQSCSGKVLTPRGTISVSWVREGDELEITATTPPGVTVVGQSVDGQRFERKPGRHVWRQPVTP